MEQSRSMKHVAPGMCVMFLRNVVTFDTWLGCRPPPPSLAARFSCACVWRWYGGCGCALAVGRVWWCCLCWGWVGGGQRARPGEQLDYSKNDEFSAGAWLPCTQASKRWNCFCLPPLRDNMMAYSKICMYI